MTQPWKFAEAMLYSLLPERARRGWRPESTRAFERAALLSALLELIAGLSLLVVRYARFFVERVNLLDAATHGVLSHANEGTQLYGAWIITLDYLVQPMTLLLLWLTLEGAVRAVSAGFLDEVLPSLPVKLVSAVIARRWSPDRTAAALPDSVSWEEKDGVDMQISSSREKDWQPPMTLELAEERYELLHAERVRGERPFVYSFRKQPAEKLIRRLVHYKSS